MADGDLCRPTGSCFLKENYEADELEAASTY